MTNEEMIIKLEEDGLSTLSDMEFIVNALEENSKLKAEIKRLNGKSEMYRDMADSFCNSNIKLKAEIEQLKEQNKHYFEQYAAAIDEIERLKSELKQSVRLPYLAGTPLYFAFSKQGIVKDKIRRWQINEHGIVFYSKGSAYPVEFIGKYAFLTREEAEQSLKATQP